MKCPICKENAIDFPDERVCSECLDILAEGLTRRVIEKILAEIS